MVALVGILSNLRRSEDLARQRGEAQRIAQAEIAKFPGVSLIDRPSGLGPKFRRFPI